MTSLDYQTDTWNDAWLTADEAKARRTEERMADIHAIELKSARHAEPSARYLAQLAEYQRAVGTPLSFTPQPDLAAIKRRQALAVKYAVRALVWGAGVFACLVVGRWAVIVLWSAWTVTH